MHDHPRTLDALLLAAFTAGADAQNDDPMCDTAERFAEWRAEHLPLPEDDA